MIFLQDNIDLNNFHNSLEYETQFNDRDICNKIHSVESSLENFFFELEKIAEDIGLNINSSGFYIDASFKESEYSKDLFSINLNLDLNKENNKFELKNLFLSYNHNFLAN